jgi:pimeloyl-ACP methyl ester carboxylesterase
MDSNQQTSIAMPGLGGGYCGLRMENAAAQYRLVWAHGWGHDHRAFLAISQSFLTRAENLLLDLPGFGAAPMPPLDWGTADYADAAAEMLRGLPAKRTIWIGHSYGCRVGLQLAARHPESVSGLLLIAAAGLPRRRTLVQKIRRMIRIGTYKGMKALITDAGKLEELRKRFGSADYRAAGPMRPILVRAVNEDLSAQAATISCPVNLVYGSLDQDTPPELGVRFKDMIGNSNLSVIPELDHYSILTDGKYHVARILDKMMNGI